MIFLETRASLRWRQLTFRGRLVDGSGQILGQQIRDLVDGNTEFGGQFLHLFRAERLLHLLAGDREIGACGYPRLGLLAKAGLLEFGDDALDAARLDDIALDERQCLGTDDTAQNSI